MSEGRPAFAFGTSPDQVVAICIKSRQINGKQVHSPFIPDRGEIPANSEVFLIGHGRGVNRRNDLAQP